MNREIISVLTLTIDNKTESLGNVKVSRVKKARESSGNLKKASGYNGRCSLDLNVFICSTKSL